MLAMIRRPFAKRSVNERLEYFRAKNCWFSDVLVDMQDGIAGI